jgi:hypothetical protein
LVVTAALERNMLQEGCFMTKSNVIEEDKVLMNLSHVSYVRNPRNIEELCKKTDGEKLTHPRHARAVHLQEGESFCLEKVFAQDTIGDVLAGSDPYGATAFASST